MNIQMKTGRQKGFTIIELVVVILLLGILAATALPRFMDVTDEAHTAVVDALEGGLVTGAALFRSTWVAQGQSVTEDIAGFGAGTLYANSYGYPVGTAVSASMAAGSCLQVYDGLLQSGRPLAASVTVSDANKNVANQISSAINGAADGVQVVAVTYQTVGTDYPNSTQCDFYYIGQYPDAPASTETAITIPKLSLDLTNGTVTRTDFTYQLPAP